MSIIDRLNLLVRSELSELSSKGEKYRSTMSDVGSSMRGAKRQQIELGRMEKDVISRIRETRAKADTWEERAILALKAGEEDLAKDALIVKNKTLDEADNLRDELRDIRSEMKDLQSAMEALEMKLEGTKIKKQSRGNADANRSETNWDAELERRKKKGGGNFPPSYKKSDDDLFETIGGTDGTAFDTDRSFREFDRMSKKIGELEADVDAYDDLSGDDWVDPRRRELESIFSKMEKKKKSSDDLSNLKKKSNDDLSDLKKKFE